MKENEFDKKTNSNTAFLSDKKPHNIIDNNKSENDKDKDKLLENNDNNKVLNNNTKYNKSFNLRCNRIGNTYIFLVDKKNNPLITIGPQWFFFIFLISFMTGGFIFLFIFYWKFLNLFLRITGISAYMIFFYVYTYLFLSDPGISKGTDENIVNKEKGKYIYCSLCKHWVSIESKTKHCSICGICIEGHDHHCSWTSKCIANKNLYFFYFLIFWVVIIIVYYALAFVYAHEKWFRYKRELLKLKREGN